MSEEIRREQAYIDRLYQRVDMLREQAADELAGVLRQERATAQALVEREAATALHAAHLARLDAAESGLCFGRLDLLTGERRYIGRIGLRAEAEEDEPLLLDWRAPAARAFYVGTAGAPHGVRRRRHILTRGRRVTGLDDEVLDRAALAGTTGLSGEAALLAAVEAQRTGRMRDIVATLQAEQDAVVRSDHRGILVVQGGPGTGKTAVALHRAAYLLYTHQHLAARGVLVVGPNATFLTYISQVLPGLGETSVLLATIGDLFPGVTADRAEERAAEEIKGRAMMAGVLAAAVRDRQAATGGTDIEFAGETIHLSARAIRAAARRARDTGLPRNQARPVFKRLIVTALADLYAARTRELADQLDADVADILAGVSAAIEADLAAGTSGPPPRRRPASASSGSRTPGACWRSPGVPRPPTWTTARCCGRPTWWAPRRSRNATRNGACARSPSGQPPTARGRSATSSWTRRRNCPRWRGGC